MVKLIFGATGSGKTKTIIDMVNSAVKESKGNVVCIAKGDKLKFDISYDARLINVDEYAYLHPETPNGIDKNGVASYYSTNVTTWTSSSTLKWEYRQLRHSLQLMAGAEIEANSLNYSNMIASNFASEDLSSIANASQMEQMNEFGKESIRWLEVWCKIFLDFEFPCRRFFEIQSFKPLGSILVGRRLVDYFRRVVHETYLMDKSTETARQLRNFG